jgi:hypothetical protein
MSIHTRTKIRVVWKNWGLAACGFAALVVFLSFYSVPNLRIFQYIGTSILAVLALVLIVRAVMIGIFVSESQIILRRLLYTRCIPFEQISSVEVGDEASPVARLYLVFNLTNGQKNQMKDVFLWGLTKNARHRVEAWAQVINDVLSATQK